MAVTREEVGAALIAADKAGDTEDARQLADYLRNMPEDEPDNMSSEDQVSNLINSEVVDFSDESWMDDKGAASRMLLDGLTLGLGNEGLAALYAAGQTSKGSDYQETYDAYFKELVEEKKQYQNDFPAASLTLQLLGGLGTGIFGVGRAAARYGMKGLVAEGAAIGAVAGAASTDEGDRLEGLTSGGVFGLLGSTALGSVGKGINAVSKRRIAKDLTSKDGTFTPITLADDAPDGLKATYRDVIGSAFWGQSTILAQQKAVMKSLKDRLIKNEQELDKAISSTQTRGVRVSLKEKENNALQLKNAKEAEKSGKEQATTRFNANAEQEKNLITVAANKVQEANQFVLRANIFKASIPEGTPIAARESIGKALTSGKPNAYQEATLALQNAWKNYGYKMLEELPNGTPRLFKLDIKKLGAETTKAIQANPKYAASINKKAPIDPNLQNMLDELTALTNKGSITGKDISRIRSQARTSINSTSNNPNTEMANIVFNTLEKSLTKTIKSQLDKPSLAAFNKTQKQYGTSRLLETVSLKSARKNGAFTATEWIDTLKASKFNKSKVSTGQGVFQSEAMKVERMGAKLEQKTNQRLEGLAEGNKANLKKVQKKVRNRAQKEIARLEKEKANIPNKTGDTPEILALKETVDTSTAQIKKLESEGAKSSSIFASLAGTGFLGGVVGSLFGAATGGLATGAGMLTARGLASKTGQTLAAGQTKTQAQIQAASQALQPSISRGVPAMIGLSAGEGIDSDEQYKQRMMNREFSR
tara:strand:+ start:1651 stop:3939 length:2289 start_codon:yes stop_codon:yes gene_type:complete